MSSAAASSSSSSLVSSSDSEHRPSTTKRKFEENFDSDDATSDSESESSEDEDDATPSGKLDQETPAEGDDPVLSHAAQRRQKKKAKLTEKETSNSKSSKSRSKPDAADASKSSALLKRQNSVWVGNLSFKTTSEALKKFFHEAGEVTRVHMPTKSGVVAADSGGHTGKGGNGGKTENRGFAYVDFSTPEEKVKAIAMSERNLDGRRLLIKDGDDFANRPTPATPTAANPGTGHSKTALKILAVQKRPPAPTLFVGNLGFEATEESIRKMVEAHGKATAVFGKGKEKEKSKKRDKDLEDAEEGEKSGEEEEEEIDIGIRKVRVGQFEDSGLCKGFAFIDFATTEQATAALTNPRNHYLDGRKLVLEYASADAVKRSGLHRDGEDKASGDKFESGARKGGKRRPGKQMRASMREAAGGPAAGGKLTTTHAEEQMNVDEADADDSCKTPHTENRRPKKPLPNGKQYANPRHRAKPGAALAQAQREKVAIVPSQGTRMVFS